MIICLYIQIYTHSSPLLMIVEPWGFQIAIQTLESSSCLYLLDFKYFEGECKFTLYTFPCGASLYFRFLGV